MTDDEQVEAIHSAITTTLGGFCTKWALIAEIADPDTGEPFLHTLTAPQQARWDTLGLLGFARRFVEIQIEGPQEDL